MKLAIFGDIHGDIPGMYKYLLEYEQRTGVKFDAVIQVGDFGIFLPNITSSTDAYPFVQYWSGERVPPIFTYICPGNHESWAVLKAWEESQHKFQIENMMLIPDGGCITLEDGTSVGAIWGNFSWKSWTNPKRVLDARRNYDKHFSHKAMHILKESVNGLLTFPKVDILITHDCPHGMAPMFGQPPDFIKEQLGLEKDEEAAGCPGFNLLHMTLAPKYHFFGHFHKYAEVSTKEYPVKVIALGCFNYTPDSALYVLDTEELCK